MPIIPLAEILITDRVRKNFPAKDSIDLANSIIEDGLIHAPVVVALDPQVPDEEGKLCSYRLVAGHRRCIAVRNIYKRERSFYYNGKEVPQNHIPVTIAKDDKPETIKAIELHENIARLDLTWQERAAAIAQLHELRGSQNTTQTFKDTAQEIAGEGESPARFQRTVSNAVALYQRFDDPEVAGARTERDAMTILMRKFEEGINRATRRPIQHSPHRLLYGNSIELLPLLPANSFSCLLTDPPYGIDADSFGDAAKLSHLYSDDRESAYELYEILLKEADRILTEDAHIYIFCDIESFPFLTQTAAKYFKPWRTPLTWDKGNRGHLPSGIASGWRRSSEWIFHAVRGARLHTSIANDVIEAEWKEEKIHGAQKPSDLYYKLLKMSCYPGEHVLDPFCGSGPIFKAAKQLSLKATGIEREERWITHIESTHQLRREALVDGTGTTGTAREGSQNTGEEPGDVSQFL